MPPEDGPANQWQLRLNIEYVQNALELARSFAHKARSSSRCGDHEHEEMARQHAEYFYSDAWKVLETLKGSDIHHLLVEIVETRRMLDQLDPRARSTLPKP